MRHLNEDAFVGCLLGTAVGDALGLAYEGLSPRRAARLYPDTSRHHLVFGKGMVSDDTEHAALVAQAIIRSGRDVSLFRRALSRSLRWWLLALPAGVGFATLRAIVRLWIGISPERSGVFSAGNGPAMRSPILGVAFGHDPDELRRFVKASTEMTHSDPKAFYAALAVAAAARDVVFEDSDWQDEFLRDLERFMPEEGAAEFLDLAARAAASAEAGESISVFADSIGSARGISGYSYHTVPCVLQVWFRHGDEFSLGLREIIGAGGDTDTSGAIFGGIVGARGGKRVVPRAWLEDIVEWPRSVRWLERLGEAVCLSLQDRQEHVRAPRYFVPGVLLRNVVFLLIVLAHGFRRLAPPY